MLIWYGQFGRRTSRYKCRSTQLASATEGGELHHNAETAELLSVALAVSCGTRMGLGKFMPFTPFVVLQAEEIVMLSSLAREAAELLWEMVATEDVGDATQQMRDNASTIQVR